jgi:hypothetical protein
MGFFYVPHADGDLYRIYETMEWYSSMELAHFVENYVVTASVPVARLFYWAVSKTGVFNLLPVISCALCYSLIFDIILKTQEKFGISKMNTALTLLFIMAGSMYSSVVGGIRMMIAMSLIVHCFFYESVLQKFRWRHILFYAIAVFTHNIAVIILALRMVLLVLDSQYKWYIRGMLILLIAAIGVVMGGAFPGFLLDVLENAGGYLTGESYSDVWEYMMGTLMGIFFIVLAVRFRTYGGSALFPSIRAYNTGMFLVITIAVLFFMVFSIFYRFIGHLAPLLAIPMLMTTLQESSRKSPVRFDWFSMQGTVLIYSAVLLLLSCSRGSLSSLKFFVLE